jgi:hypothetical protein
MSTFLDANPGLRGRIALNLHFPDLTAEAAAVAFERLLGRASYELQGVKVEVLEAALSQLRTLPGYANARTIVRFYEAVRVQQERRLTASTAIDSATRADLTALTEGDINAAVSAMRTLTPQ